jgi:hypothetical protein
MEVAGVYQLQQIDPEQTYFVSHSVDLSQFFVQKSDLDMGEFPLPPPSTLAISSLFGRSRSQLFCDRRLVSL